MLIRIHPQSSLKRKSSGPQKRASLPSLASLYHGSHTGRFLCSLVPATTVSPAYPRMSEGREVNKGLEKIKHRPGDFSADDKGKGSVSGVEGTLSTLYLTRCAHRGCLLSYVNSAGDHASVGQLALFPSRTTTRTPVSIPVSLIYSFGVSTHTCSCVCRCAHTYMDLHEKTKG